jgi:transcriptional regulator with XRE-family HTH domain
MSWAQVDVLRSMLDAHKKATGETNADVAQKLETTIGTLGFWLTGTRTPKRANLQKLAAFFGCSVTRFMDDPNQEVAGRTAEGKSEQRRVLGGMMWDGIMDEGLSDEDAALLFEDFLASKSRLASIKARTRSAGS